MKTIAITGRLTRDAETRQAGGDTVTRFSVAVDDRKGQEKGTIYFDCDMWGKRGTNLQPSLKKGTGVAVSGEFSTREYNGKTYLTIRADAFDFTGGAPRQDREEQPEQRPARRDDLDSDSIPF